MTLDSSVLLAILLMGLATYVTRSSGYLLLRWRRPGPRRAAGLEAMPGAILISIIAPGIADGGVSTWVAAALTLVMAARLPAAVAVAGGVLCLVALRAAIG